MLDDRRIETMARWLFAASPAAGWTSWDRLYEPARERWRAQARERLAAMPADQQAPASRQERPRAAG
jgi:hypothetical protein